MFLVQSEQTGPAPPLPPPPLHSKRERNGVRLFFSLPSSPPARTPTQAFVSCVSKREINQQVVSLCPTQLTFSIGVFRTFPFRGEQGRVE